MSSFCRLIAGAGVLLALAVFGAIGLQGVSRADGGDFSLDLVAAAPDTYVHSGASQGQEVALGGLQYDSRDINLYVRESLEAEDFACDDRAVFFTQVTTDAGAIGTQTIEIDYEFDAEPTGQPAVGYSDIIAAGLSGPGGFPGWQTSEAGNQNLDGNETVLLIAESVQPPGSTLGVDAQEIAGTVQVAGLDGGDVVIVRVDVRFSCFPSSTDPTGTLHAVVQAARTSLGDAISVGQQDIPMINLGVIETSTPTNTFTPTPTAPGSTPAATPTPTGTPVVPPGASPTPTPGVPLTPVPTDPPAAPPASYPPGQFPPSGSGPGAGGISTSLAGLLAAIGLSALAAGAMRRKRGFI